MTLNKAHNLSKFPLAPISYLWYQTEIESNTSTWLHPQYGQKSKTIIGISRRFFNTKKQLKKKGHIASIKRAFIMYLAK
jgi:hypothetical protein